MTEKHHAFRHGGAISGTEERKAYIVWTQMIRRCTKPTTDCFAGYGARGIQVCERWGDFGLFFQDMWPRPEGMTLERVDNDKGYNPDNVKWATRKEQAQNRRGSKIIKIQGVSKTLAQWTDESGLGYHTVYTRLQRGWDVMSALTTPARPRVVRTR